MSATSDKDRARGVPFRPRLHGNFRARFYRAASRLDRLAGTETIAAIVQQEIDWVQTACHHNLAQRTRYRAIWLLLRDLLSSSWTPDYRQGVLLLAPQKLHDSSCDTPQEQKLRLRKRMEQRRLDHLQSSRSFVERMERANSHGRSIADLIADGPELATRLQGAQAGLMPLGDAVKPYLQLVDNDATDDFTGLKLPDIWRYFRLT